MNYKAIKSAAISLWLCLCCGCSNDLNVGNYKISINAPHAGEQTVRVLIYEPNYGHLRIINSGKLKAGKLQLSGQVAESHIAYLDYGGKQFLPFILEKCETDIAISKENVVIWGGEENHQYFSTCNKIVTLDRQVKNIEATYQKQLSDSSLTKKTETALLKKHRTYCQALQRTITDNIKRGGKQGILIKERFISKLDSAHIAQIR